MFDAPAAFAGKVGGEVADRGERLGIGGVADRMDRDLKLVHRRAHHLVAKLCGGEEGQTLLTRRVAVWRLQPCAARAQSPVEVELYPDHAQPVVIEPRRRFGPGDDRHIVDVGAIAQDTHRQLFLVARAAKRLPVGDAGAHVGDRGDPLFEQFLLRKVKRAVEVTRERFGLGVVDEAHCRIDENAARLAALDLDPAAFGRLAGGGDLCGCHSGGVRPTSVTVDAFEPDGAVRDRGVEIGGGREAAEAPFFLIPTRPDDPRHFGVVGGIFADRRLRFGKAAGVRQVEQHELKAQPHDMAMRVDQAGNERAALSVFLEIGAFGALVLAVEQLFHLALRVDHEAGEADELAILVERDAVDIVDERIGVRGGGEGEGCEHEQAPPACGRGCETCQLAA